MNAQIGTLGALALVIGAGVPTWSGIVRGRAYAVWTLVVLLMALPGALVMHARLVTWLAPAVAGVAHVAFCWMMAAAGVHMTGLVRARLRPPVFRWLVSIPGMAFLAAGALSGAWLLALLPVRVPLALAGAGGWLDTLRWLDLVPFGVAASSVVTSLRHRTEVVRVTLDRHAPAEMTRLPVQRLRYSRRRPPTPLVRRPLRIVQVTDPHLGPWQPIDLLRRRLERLLAHDPDLVLLTGDFLTMEGAGSPGALAEALAPLDRLPGRAFAVFGNHDHEDPDEVRAGLVANGVRLLLDDEAVVETRVGPVQLVGADWVGRGRRERLRGLLARFPRRTDHLRLLLLHDPSAFRHAPPGDVDLALSGHTHGGQLGLLSFGFEWTVLRRTRWPDHGLFGLGASRLYVHRGTGFYGFPLRVGVPGELSVLELVVE